MTDRELFNLHNPDPDQIQLRVSKAIELYNHGRSALIDDDIARLRGQLSCDLYKYVADVFKPALQDLYRCELELEKADGSRFLALFEEARSKGISISAAETVARKSMKCDPIYLEALKNFQDAKVITEVMNQINKMATQVLHAMAYKAN